MVDLGTGQLALLAGAGLAAGAVNGVAGGGSLISFPALLAVGYPSVSANVTNMVAVLPGYVGGSVGYRRELAGQRARMIAFGITSAVGSIGGAILLTESPPGIFKAAVPWLILFSCGLLAAQPLVARLGKALRGGGPAHRSPAVQTLGLVAAVYGGYFGAGTGILLLAILGPFLDDSLQRVNALKAVLSLVIGLVSAAYFAVFGPVAWLPAGVMAGASLVGGQAGVVLARRLRADVLRGLVVAFGVAVAIVLLVG